MKSNSEQDTGAHGKDAENSAPILTNKARQPNKKNNKKLEDALRRNLVRRKQAGQLRPPSSEVAE